MFFLVNEYNIVVLLHLIAKMYVYIKKRMVAFCND